VTSNENCHLGLGYVRPWHFDLDSFAATCTDGYPSDFYRNFLKTVFRIEEVVGF
jgi:hypothetical protein